ncbi:hypothetical protein EE612_025158 [Oryza sativa]|nr:hypothetical protein EE612_025158 [Oryza sativa]
MWVIEVDSEQPDALRCRRWVVDVRHRVDNHGQAGGDYGARVVHRNVELVRRRRWRRRRWQGRVLMNPRPWGAEEDELPRRHSGVDVAEVEALAKAVMLVERGGRRGRHEEGARAAAPRAVGRGHGER